MKKPSLTDTVVSYYSLSDFGQRVQASNAAKSQIMMFIDPVSAANFQFSSGVAEWIYQWASNKYQVDIKLRAYFLPADRVVISINGIKTKLSVVADFMPQMVCQVFPVDLLCQDLANLAARTESVLKLRPRMVACLSHTAKIAQEVVVDQIADQVKKSAQKKVVEAVVPAVTRAIPSAPAPSKLSAKGVHRATSLIPDADPTSVAGKLTQVAKSDVGKGLFGMFAGFVETQVKTAVQGNNNNPEGGFANTVLKLASSEPAKKAAAFAAEQIEKAAPEAEETVPSISVEDIVAQAVDATGSIITEAAKEELAKSLQMAIDELSAELIEQEAGYITQARALVIDNTVKLALAYAISTGAGWFILPNVAKQFFNLFLPAGVADLAASAVSWGSLICTGIAYFNHVSAYRADRQANQNRFAPLGNIESKITTEVQTQIEKVIPTVIAQRSSFFEQFRSRCLAELPEVFKKGGDPEMKL